MSLDTRRSSRVSHNPKGLRNDDHILRGERTFVPQGDGLPGRRAGSRGPRGATRPVLGRDHQDRGSWRLDLAVVVDVGRGLRQPPLEPTPSGPSRPSARKKSRKSRLRRTVALVASRTWTLLARSPTGGAKTSFGHDRPALTSMRFQRSGRRRKPIVSKRATTVSLTSSSTRTWTSMQSLADRPGTAVDPM